METLSSKYINVNGSLLDLSGPCVMGILNITPDSFYAGSRMHGRNRYWMKVPGL